MKTRVGFQFVIFQDPKALVFKARVSTVSVHNTLRPKPTVEIFLRRTKLYFVLTRIKLRSSFESDVELRMRRANLLNETRNKLCSERG